MILWKDERFIRRLFFILVIFYLLEGIFWILFGNVWTDENWYFANSYLASKGKLPYRDFYDFHLPLSSLIFALPQYFFGPSLLIGRLTSFLFNLISILLVCNICKKLAGWRAVFLVLTLQIVNMHALHFSTCMAPHTIECFFVVYSMYILTTGIKKPYNYILSVAVMCVANSIKYVTNPWLFSLLLIILIKERKNRKIAIYCFATAIFAMFILLMPFVIISKGKFFNDIIWPFRGSYLEMLGFKWIGAVDRILYLVPIIQNYFSMFLLLPAFLIYFWLIKDKRKSILSYISRHYIIGFTALAITIWFAMSYLNMMTVQPHSVTVSYYYPLIALLMAIGIIKVFETLREKNAQYLFKILISLLIFLTPFLQPENWQMLNIKWDKRELICISEVAEKIRNYSHRGERVFTFTPAFAAQADREPLKGMEFDVYSYLPFMETKKCRQMGFLNKEILLDYLTRREAAVLVLTQDRFFEPFGRAQFIKKDLPEIIEAINANYYLKEKIPYPKIFRGDVYIYLPRAKD